MAEEALTTETLIAVILLIVFILIGPFFEKIHFHYAHESGVVMILGIVAAYIMNQIDPHASFAKSLGFDSEVFFTLILPPIIFAAGYNLRKKFFFKYLFYILLFGVIGTVCNFCLVAPLTMIVNSSYGFSLSNKLPIYDEEGKIVKEWLHQMEGYGKEEERRRLSSKRLLEETEEFSETSKTETKQTLVKSQNTTKEHEGISHTEVSKEESHKPKHGERGPPPYGQPLEVITFSTNEILLFASVISATDAVAALAFVKEESDPKLFPILFGEGVVNDAVCIVLYQIIKSFLDSGERKIIFKF